MSASGNKALGRMNSRKSIVPNACCIVVILLLANPALGKEFTCRFHTVCFNDHPCEPRESSISIIAEGEFQTMDSPGLNFRVTERYDPENDAYSYVTDLSKRATSMLTIFQNGEARLTGHTFLDRAVSQTYMGRCEER